MTIVSRLQSRKALRAARVALQCATSHMPIKSSMGDRPTLSPVLGRSRVQRRHTAAATPSNDATTRMALDDGVVTFSPSPAAFSILCNCYRANSRGRPHAMPHVFFLISINNPIGANRLKSRAERNVLPVLRSVRSDLMGREEGREGDLVLRFAYVLSGRRERWS